MIIDLVNTIFKPLIDLGTTLLMTIALASIALCFKVKPTCALEGGLKLGTVLTNTSAIIGILTTAFSDAVAFFIERTGVSLNITSVGQVSLTIITRGSPCTLYFLLIMVIVNIIMLILNKTNTLDVNILDTQHLSIVGLFAIFCGASLMVATILVISIDILKIINSGLMKPTFNDLLNAPDANPMTTTRMNYMMSPIIMVFDKIPDKLFPWLDKYDFDTAKLNSKISFWRSKFTIRIYLEIFVGLLADRTPMQIFSLPSTAVICLELSSLIGIWFIVAVEPLSRGITDFASSKLKERALNIGLSWPFLVGCTEIWAAVSVLAPIMLLEVIALPGNKLLPSGEIIAMDAIPALLIVTRSKLIRMIIIRAIKSPLPLWSGTLIAPLITGTAKKIGTLPASLDNNTLISHTIMEEPMEEFLGYSIGNTSQGQLEFILCACLVLIAYLLVFIWYAKQMKKRNIIYVQKAQ